MGLVHNFCSAHRLLDQLTEAEKHELELRCRTIQEAQGQLNQVCADAFYDCMTRCQGKCCRNIHAGSIISLLDCLFILALNRDLFQEVLKFASAEGLFSADCPFLIGGVGPCLFPADQKPEQCIITFCSSVPTARKPVRKIRSAFTRLWWYVFFRRPLFWIGW